MNKTVEDIKNGILNAFDEILQWTGATFIIIGHYLNAIGIDGYNIIAFLFGTFAFLIWTIRVVNKPQMVVNIVAMATCSAGLYRAFVA